MIKHRQNKVECRYGLVIPLGRSGFTQHRVQGFRDMRIRFVYLVSIVLLFFSLSAFSGQENVPGTLSSDTKSIKLASYNIKWFGSTDADIKLLARVIQEFDICGIIEIRNERALSLLDRELEAQTGAKWGYVFGHRTHRKYGSYYEAFAFVWRQDRVSLNGGMVSNLWDREDVYRNDPYIASFSANDKDFTVILIHTRWSADSEGTRKDEVLGLVEVIENLSSFLSEEDIFIAGDFNFPTDNSYMKQFSNESNMELLSSSERSTLSNQKPDYVSSYDHIYGTAGAAAMIKSKGLVFDVTQFIYKAKTIETMRMSMKELSDHIPVYVELNVGRE